MPETRTLKAKLRAILPPAFVALVRVLRRRRVLLGRYRTWAEARAASKGYDDGAVFEKVLLATRAVVEGRAKWDRDGAVFDNGELNEPLLAVLRRIAGKEGGVLDLVDFGGALGSTWRQHRLALADVSEIRWRVVEQAHYVEAGKPFADSTLSFHRDLNSVLDEGGASTLLLSSVLPYIESPRVLLASAVVKGMRHIVIDRTSFAVDGQEQIVVQQAPAELGGGSYPCWLFNRVKLFEPMEGCYRLEREWQALDDVDPRAVYRGFHFERIA